jgi:hypothetical protein
MGETRKIAASLVADMVGYSRLAGTDEDRPHCDSVLQIAASAANLSFTKAPVWGISVKTFSVRFRICTEVLVWWKPAVPSIWPDGRFPTSERQSSSLNTRLPVRSS